MRTWIRVLMWVGAMGLAMNVSEAAIKPSQQSIDVVHYRIALDLDDAAMAFSGTVDITFRAIKRVHNVWFHQEGLQIDRVEQQGAAVEFRTRKDRVEIQLAEALPANQETTVRVAFAGKVNTRSQEGLFAIQQPGHLPSFYTQFEAQNARKVFPCFDEPFDKATSEVVLSGHAKYTLLSNGTLVEERRLPNGRKQAHFRNVDPMSTYLITMVAAELEKVESTYRSSKGIIPLAIYVAPGHGDEVGVALHALRESMAFFEEYFGEPYPWESYGIVAVEGFSWGGMENKGLTNLNAHSLYWSPDHPYRKQLNILALVAHELAHEWFGNLVTMHWWHDLWLNEAFATFMEQKVMAQVHGDDVALLENQEWLKKDYFPQDGGVLAHPIVVRSAHTVDELFDAVTYAKGVQVVRMMEDFVGEENFQRAIQNYLKEFRFLNATTEEFLRTIEATTKVSLGDFANSWLDRAGFPRIAVTSEWNAEAHQLHVRLTQHNAEGDAISRPFLGVMPLGLFGADYAHQIDIAMVHSQEALALDLTAPPLALSMNRAGHFLAQFEMSDELAQLPTLLRKEEFGIARAMAVSRVIAQEHPLDGMVPVVRQALGDESMAVRKAVVGAILRSGKSAAWRKTVARGVQEALLDNLRMNPTEPIVAMLQEQSLILLGETDDPALYGLLHARLGHAVVDVQLGALAGLLRTSEPTRFQSAADMIAGIRGDSARALEMLKVLARTPDTAIFAELRSILADPTIVSRDDSSTPIRVVRVLREENRTMAYTDAGIEFLMQMARDNLDRPAVAKEALRAFEGIREAPSHLQQRVRQALRDLLDHHPSDVIASLAKQIVRAM